MDHFGHFPQIEGNFLDQQAVAALVKFVEHFYLKNQTKNPQQIPKTTHKSKQQLTSPWRVDDSNNILSVDVLHSLMDDIFSRSAHKSCVGDVVAGRVVPGVRYRLLTYLYAVHLQFRTVARQTQT